MSLKAMVWALEVRVGNPIRKLVLLKLADHANDRGECWPSLDLLSEVAEVSRRSVIRHIQDLEEMGLISKKKGSKGRSNKYFLALKKDSATLAPSPKNRVPESHPDGARVAPSVVSESHPNQSIESVKEPPPQDLRFSKIIPEFFRSQISAKFSEFPSHQLQDGLDELAAAMEKRQIANPVLWLEKVFRRGLVRTQEGLKKTEQRKAA